MVNGSDIISYAKQFIGVPYKWVGSTPSGFDCSGLVQYVYKHFGIGISRTTSTQINEGRAVGRNELQLGDLVFPSTGHVTLYVGNNQVLHAPEPGKRVTISKLWKFWQARRILNDESPNIDYSEYERKIEEIMERTKITKIPIGNFALQTPTCLEQTKNNYQFLVGDYNYNGVPDVYCIKKNGGCGKTEVHVLNGSNNYQNFIFQRGTCLHETDDNWQFCLGDYNGDGYLDLYCIAKRNTGSHSTEVHILSGKSNFQEFIMQIGTCLHETGENWDFGVLGKHLCCINKYDTGSGTTEIHLLDGNNNFQNFIIQTETKLHETGNDFAFYVYGNTLFVFAKQGNSNSTEVHCLSLQL